MIEQATAALLPIAAWLLFASLKSIVVIPLVLLIRHFCARWLGPQGRYGLWLAVVACLAIPFGARVDIRDDAVARVAVAPVQAQVAVLPGVTYHEQPIINMAGAPEERASLPSLRNMAILIWMLGVAGLAATVLCNATRYARMRSTASKLDAATDELFQSCKRTLGIRGHVRLRETSRVGSPVLVGYWRPTLLLPENLPAEINREQLRLVLLHELTHVRRHDILVNWLITFVQVAHWFNPLAWYALRMARHDMEQACDAGVLRHLTAAERFEYGDTLIKLSDITPRRTLLVQSASVVESRTQLKERINMIARFKSRGVGSSIAGAVLVAVTCVVAVTQAADAPQQSVKAPLPIAPVAGTQQGPVTSQKEIPPQKKPLAGATARAPNPTAIAARQETTDPAALETASFQIKYPTVKVIAAFISSAPGGGLLSAEGSLAIDEGTNTMMVHDTAANVAAIRQLVARLDAPVEEVLLVAQFAMLDEGFIQELKASGSDGKMAPAILLGVDTTVAAELEAGMQAQRGEVISRPHVILANRRKTSIEQSVGMPPQANAPQNTPAKNLHMKLELTPTLRPDKSITLDLGVNINVTSNSLIVTTSPNVPSIDSNEINTQLILESGTTVMLDFTGHVGAGIAREEASEHTRRLVAFITLKRLLPPPPPK